MHRLTRLVFISALSLSLSSCAKTKPIHYYTVALPVAPTLSTSAHPLALLVGTIGGRRYIGTRRLYIALAPTRSVRISTVAGRSRRSNWSKTN